MNRVRRIRIQGFRSLRDVDLKLDKLTVLLGANGAGKTNFVSFFNMLHFMAWSQLQLYLARRGSASSILHYGPKQTPVLRGEIEFENDNSVNEYAFSLGFASPDRLIFMDEIIRSHQGGGSPPSVRSLGSSQLESLLSDFARHSGIEGEQLARPIDRFFKKTQEYHFHDTSGASHIRISENIDLNDRLLSDGGNLAAFLYMLKTTRPNHFANILSTVRLVIPFLRELVLEPDLLNPARIQLRWSDNNPDYEFGPHQFSDGSLRAIALITALLQPQEFMPAILFIDEPELGLHPKALSIIASLIKAASEKRQIVVSTQSPRLVAEFEPENIVVVERCEDERGFGESLFNRLSREDLGDWVNQYDLGTLFEMNVTGGGPS